MQCPIGINLIESRIIFISLGNPAENSKSDVLTHSRHEIVQPLFLTVLWNSIFTSVHRAAQVGNDEEIVQS